MVVAYQDSPFWTSATTLVRSAAVNWRSPVGPSTMTRPMAMLPSMKPLVGMAGAACPTGSPVRSPTAVAVGVAVSGRAVPAPGEPGERSAGGLLTASGARLGELRGGGTSVQDRSMSQASSALIRSCLART